MSDGGHGAAPDLDLARPFAGGRRLIPACLIFSCIGMALTGLGVALAPEVAFSAQLVAVTYVLSLSVGLVGFLVISHSMNAGWPTAVRRPAEAGAMVMPVVGLLFVPIFFGLRHLYPWAHIDAITEPLVREAVQHKQAYLFPAFFTLRALAFFALWSAVAMALYRWSVEGDAQPRFDFRPRLRALSAISAPALALSLTIAVTDWIMSLAPEWVSYIFGFYFIALSILGGLALLVVLVALGHRAGLLPFVSESHYYALGRALFAFLIVWAYTAYFNYFIIWIADKPPEARWFVLRSSGLFGGVSLFLVLGRFALSFFVLLSYRWKRRRRPLVLVAAFILATQYIEVHWLIAPQRSGAGYHWLDASALLGVVGLSLAFGLWAQRGHAMAPVHDRRLHEAIRYVSK
jgi:hypothetical protein